MVETQDFDSGDQGLPHLLVNVDSLLSGLVDLLFSVFRMYKATECTMSTYILAEQLNRPVHGNIIYSSC